MAKVDKSAMHDFYDGETVVETALDQNFELLRVALNDVDDKANANATILSSLQAQKADKSYVDSQDANLQSQINSLNSQVTLNTSDINNLKTQKADKVYVDQQIAFIQNGQVADNAVSTSKIQDRAVTTQKLADGAVTASKVDNVTVYTGAKTDSQINNAVNTAKSQLQSQINTNATNISNLQSQLDATNRRIDGLQYNIDLYSAKQDIIVLALNVEVLKGAQLTGISQNMVIETLADVSDLTITQGLYDSTNKKIYLP